MIPGEDSSGRAFVGKLLADLAEGVIGKHVSAQGALESVPTTRLTEIRQRIGGLPPSTDLTRWLEWFFADRGSRTISPYSQIDMPHYITALTTETNVNSWREALMLCPTNGKAFAKLARHHLQKSRSPDSSDAVQADWASRQAVKFAPLDTSIWEQRVEVVLHTGGWTNLLAESEQMLQSYPEMICFWNSKARALEGLEQFQAAQEACSHALESLDAHAEPPPDPSLRQEILERRARALNRLGRTAEAELDKPAAHHPDLSLPSNRD
jgi:hypothetical protein